MGKVTLQSIADEVGVSRMTVSNAFNRPDKLSAAVREQILAVAERLGYVGPDPSARALARGRTGTVGLLLTGGMGEVAADAVATEFLVTVADALARENLALTLIPAGIAGETVPTRDVPMDGALVYVCEPDSADLARLRRRALPLVTVDQQPIPGVPGINVDDRSGARAAAQHLVDLGHRRIGIVNLQPVQEESTDPGRAASISNPPAAERLRGWRDALEPAGIEPQLVLAAYRPPEAAYDAARSLLESPDRPTGLLCFSDAFAAQALRAAADLGLKVPQELSVVGFDDSSLATSVRPALTTVAQSVAEKGRLAVRALVDQIAAELSGERGADEPSEPLRVLLPTELVVRDSTSEAPDA